MKVIALAAAVAMTATTAFAGNLAPVAVDPAPIIAMPEAVSGGSLSGVAGWLIPIIAIGAVAAVVANKN